MSVIAAMVMRGYNPSLTNRPSPSPDTIDTSTDRVFAQVSRVPNLTHNPRTQGKRRYDRKQSGYGGQTKPMFHKKSPLSLRQLRWCVCMCISEAIVVTVMVAGWLGRLCWNAQRS